jgi:hypothetical protein
MEKKPLKVFVAKPVGLHAKKNVYASATAKTTAKATKENLSEEVK